MNFRASQTPAALVIAAHGLRRLQLQCVWCYVQITAMASMMRSVMVVLVLLGVGVGVEGQSPSGGFYVVPVNCTLQESSMISTTACTYYDKQNMASETGNCQPFLTNIDAMPNAGCCEGLNQVAYYRTACLCDTTFYPVAAANFTRSLQLPSLCGIRTDLCTHCPQFLVERTPEYPVGELSPLRPDISTAF